MTFCVFVMFNNKSSNNTQDPFLNFLADTLMTAQEQHHVHLQIQRDPLIMLIVSIMLSNSHGKLANPVCHSWIFRYRLMVMRSRLTVILCFPHPHSQFLRLRHLCSDEKYFFVEHGFPTHLLDSAIEKAFSIFRRDTPKPPLSKSLKSKNIYTCMILQCGLSMQTIFASSNSKLGISATDFLQCQVYTLLN